ncbi:hypothetical protein GQ53DRAFT_668892, partial [Thozetella sp. PMI_491]
RTCLINAVANSTCMLTDIVCVCGNEAISAAATACTLNSCSIIDGLTTKNISTTICQEPVRDLSTSYAAAIVAIAIVTDFFVLLRVGYKYFIGQQFWWDDYLVVLLMLVGIPSVVITTNGTTLNGLGRDVWKLTPTEITNFIYYFYFMEILYFIMLTLLKLTLLFFYLKIFPADNVRQLTWVTIGLTTVWGLSFVLIAVFQCSPVSYYWTRWDGLHTGTCLNINAIGWANAVISIILDGWMLYIPLWQVLKLQLTWRRKAGVIAMFVVGAFVTFVSILRLQSLLNFANSANPTWDQLLVSLWSTIEISVGMICACMPTLRLILARFLPRVVETINGSAKSVSDNSTRYRSQLGASRVARPFSSESQEAVVRLYSSAGRQSDNFSLIYMTQDGRVVK